MRVFSGLVRSVSSIYHLEDSHVVAIMESGNAVGPPWNGTDWHQPMYNRIVNKTGYPQSYLTVKSMLTIVVARHPRIHCSVYEKSHTSPCTTWHTKVWNGSLPSTGPLSRSTLRSVILKADWQKYPSSLGLTQTRGPASVLQEQTPTKTALTNSYVRFPADSQGDD
jgi:hypothetical protein